MARYEEETQASHSPWELLTDPLLLPGKSAQNVVIRVGNDSSQEDPRRKETEEFFSDITHSPEAGLGECERMRKIPEDCFFAHDLIFEGQEDSEGLFVRSGGPLTIYERPISAVVAVDSHGLARGNLPSEQSEREGEAPPALPVEGATQAPIIDENGKPLSDVVVYDSRTKGGVYPLRSFDRDAFRRGEGVTKMPRKKKNFGNFFEAALDGSMKIDRRLNVRIKEKNAEGVEKIRKIEIWFSNPMGLDFLTAMGYDKELLEACEAMSLGDCEAKNYRSLEAQNLHSRLDELLSNPEKVPKILKLSRDADWIAKEMRPARSGRTGKVYSICANGWFYYSLYLATGDILQGPIMSKAEMEMLRSWQERNRLVHPWILEMGLYYYQLADKPIQHNPFGSFLFESYAVSHREGRQWLVQMSERGSALGYVPYAPNPEDLEEALEDVYPGYRLRYDTEGYVDFEHLLAWLKSQDDADEWEIRALSTLFSKAYQCRGKNVASFCHQLPFIHEKQLWEEE